MRALATMLFLWVVSSPAVSAAESWSAITLPVGTEVRLEVLATVSSETAQENQRVRLAAVDDVVVDGRVVIARGAPAEGTVTRSQRRRGFGRNGRLDFTIDTVEAIDGRNVRLRTSKSHRGRDKYVVAGVVTLLTGPFGALVKGKDIEIPAGTEYVLYIDSKQVIELPGERNGTT